MKSLKEFVNSDKYMLAAHRGSSGTAPENTLASFREALEAGVTLIEADIRFTADNHIVAFHDDIIEFDDYIKTEGSSEPWEKKFQFSSSMSLEELRKLDVGERFGKDFQGERAPLLKDILELVHNKAYINIEIKATEKLNDDKILQILEEIKQFNYLDKTLFASFNHKLLHRIKELEPRAHIAAVMQPNDERLPSEIYKSLPIEGFICSKEEINEKIFMNGRNHGIIMAVYSLDSEEDLKLLDKYPFKVIVTNYPLLIKELLLKKGIIIEPAPDI